MDSLKFSKLNLLKNLLPNHQFTSSSPLQILLVLLSGFFATAQCGGDPNAYGNEEWIGYHYTSSGNQKFSTYQGFVTESAIFDNNYPQQYFLWVIPLPHFNVCGTNFTNDFAIRYKMRKTFAAGCHTFTVGGDDGYRLSIDGGATWIIDNWSDHSYETSTHSVYITAGPKDLVLEYYDNSGDSRIKFTYGYSSPSTPPTSISGPTSKCAGTGNITLSAVGGSSKPGAVFQWGTGDVGSNILPSTTSSISVNPTSTTTYWVRRVDAAPCSQPTIARTHTVVVETKSTAPTTITASTSICLGSSITLSAGGGTMGSNAVYQWGTGSTGNNIIAGEVNSSIVVAPTSNTTYWVRRVDEAPCSAVTSAKSTTITIKARSTAPTAINGGTTTVCPGTSVTLTANGGTSASGAVYQWGTGTPGTNVIGGTGISISVNPLATTTYWVRRYDATCDYYTAAVSKTVTVSEPVVAGSLSALQTIVCSGTVPNAITLSGNGGAVIKWQSCNNSSFVGTVTDIASTSSVLTGDLMGPISSTTYYRAVIQGSCSITYTPPIAMTIPPTVTYTNGSWNGTVNESKSVIITDDITISNDLSVCSCKVAGTATVTILSGKTFTVKKSIEVTPNANIIVEPNGSILQVDDSAVNTGSITYKRQTTPMREMDFTYWSAPVGGATLYELSPQTRNDKFMSFNPIVNNWAVHLNGAEQMTAGKGYIVRAPENWSLTNGTQGKYTAEFTGVPNNGVIPVTLQKGAGTFNLIGNPYPSAIDIDLFLTDPVNENLVNGTIYLWSHNTAISSTIPGAAAYNYTADDYAKYNLTGGVKTASAAITGGGAPTGKIAAGQGFFIEANSNLSNGTYTATFNNSMRVANENNQFFRSADMGTALPREKHRLWLNISNASGAYDEMLIGYIEGATNGLDPKYDGAIFPAGNAVSIYSLLNENSLAIQGRALPFSASDIIPLGYKSTIAGTMKISIENLDGAFADTGVYLLDTSTGIMHDLKASPFSFTTTVGTFNSRFEIHFVGNALGINQPTENSSEIVAFADGQLIKINAESQTIRSVDVYDLTGKLLVSEGDIDAGDYSVELNIAPQLVLVQMTLDAETIVVRKVMIR